jgi:hypothetical protein
MDWLPHYERHGKRLPGQEKFLGEDGHANELEGAQEN